MDKYKFMEAQPFIDFIEKHNNELINHTIEKFDVLYWPNKKKEYKIISEYPVIFHMDNFCILVNYFVFSDVEVIVGKKEELENIDNALNVINIRYEVHDYYNEEFGRGIKKEFIEGCKITNIEIERFSEAFEVNPCTGEMRPDGGDYFSTIRIYLDSGIILCICGVDSITDGYISVWCE